MTTQELRELDAWIAEHVMGWVPGSMSGLWKIGPSSFRNFHPTLLAADAMDVLKKCAEKYGKVLTICSPCATEGWTIGTIDWETETVVDISEAQSLELAICLAAKQLFSQTTK